MARFKGHGISKHSLEADSLVFAAPGFVFWASNAALTTALLSCPPTQPNQYLNQDSHKCEQQEPPTTEPLRSKNPAMAGDCVTKRGGSVGVLCKRLHDCWFSAVDGIGLGAGKGLSGERAKKDSAPSGGARKGLMGSGYGTPPSHMLGALLAGSRHCMSTLFHPLCGAPP